MSKHPIFFSSSLANRSFVTYIRLKVPHKVETRPSVEGPFSLGECLVEPRLNRLTRGEESIQIELKMILKVPVLPSIARLLNTSRIRM